MSEFLFSSDGDSVVNADIFPSAGFLPRARIARRSIHSAGFIA